MNKRFIAVCSTVLCLFLAGCNSSTTTTNSSNETAIQSNATVQTKQSGPQKDSGTLGNYAVTIKSATIGKSYEGKPAVIITYDFTNNNAEPTSFMAAIGDTVYQNGVQLESTVLSNDNDNWMKNIQTGTTLEVQKAYELQDTANPIDVEITEFFSFTNDKITKSFDLK